ncbi:hypothetical protein [Pleurocapsa sp. FMAR1]|uniref:hypothetical protein n=1 Tax=Pleurocapsa sp. FMAR1 TaxID=3040204 RepID=UPI0029C675E5|nr:hypothetical protein [Pleurocapsa sp. FMAR1]
MSGFCSNINKKSSKKSKSNFRGYTDKNLVAVQKFKDGDDMALINLACQYELEEMMATGRYF